MNRAENRKIAMELFGRIRAAFPHLHMEPRENPPGESGPDAEMSIEVQPGLAFEIVLNLDGDEFNLSAGEYLWVSWNTCADKAKSAEFEDTLTGLITGKYRINERYVFGIISSAAIEIPAAGGWKTRAKTVNFLTAIIPWKRSSKILQNKPQN
jgi:hypothetical protein